MGWLGRFIQVVVTLARGVRVTSKTDEYIGALDGRSAPHHCSDGGLLGLGWRGGGVGRQCATCMQGECGDYPSPHVP